MIDSNILPFQIKICGLTQPKQAIDAWEAGADAIGLNFFEDSIRSVVAEQALLITTAVASHPRTPVRPKPKVVGVFVNHSPEQIIDLTTRLELDGIQLHGDETVDFFTNLKKLVTSKLGSKPFFVRALRTQPRSHPSDDQSEVDRNVETKRVIEQIRAWSNAGIDTVLLDAAATGKFGGTGKSIDWSLMPELQTAAEQPLALAGGLTPSNVAHAIEITQVRIVDVASGVESPKGVKCLDRVRQFVQQARLALNSQIPID